MSLFSIVDSVIDCYQAMTILGSLIDISERGFTVSLLEQKTHLVHSILLFLLKLALVSILFWKDNHIKVLIFGGNGKFHHNKGCLVNTPL